LEKLSIELIKYFSFILFKSLFKIIKLQIFEQFLNILVIQIKTVRSVIFFSHKNSSGISLYPLKCFKTLWRDYVYTLFGLNKICGAVLILRLIFWDFVVNLEVVLLQIYFDPVFLLLFILFALDYKNLLYQKTFSSDRFLE
jgi:hypothetical protein